MGWSVGAGAGGRRRRGPRLPGNPFLLDSIEG